ncbi:MAG TPA: hypothetical protein VG410_08075 [Solirubrobacteraceae bacterium]|nr:hypothetical protein [Solirubrobacteraceae bacterium]
MRLLIALVAWIGAIAASVAISTAVASSIHSSSTTTGASAPQPAISTTTPTPTAPAFNAASVKPTDPDSLFIGSNFRRIFAIAKRHLGARADIEHARLTPGELELTTVAKNDDQSAVVVDANGSYISTRTGALVGSAQVYYISQLGPNTPATLARRIAAGFHVPISHLQYMLVATDPAQQQFFWRVYPSNPGIYFRAAYARGPILELGGKRTLEIR